MNKHLGALWFAIIITSFVLVFFSIGGELKLVLPGLLFSVGCVVTGIYLTKRK